MRVLHLVDTFESAFERDQIQIVRGCVARGLDVTVVTTSFDSDGNRTPGSYHRAWDDLERPAVIIRPPSFKLRLPWCSPMFVTLPHPVLLASYDVVHIYTVGSYSFFLGYLLGTFRGPAMVLRAEISPSWHRRLTRSGFWRSIVLARMKRMAAVYALSQAERERILDVGMPADRVYTIPVGIDWEKHSSIRRSDEVLTIGYLGRFVDVKGPHRLVPIVSRLSKEYPGVRVVFAGPQTDRSYFRRIVPQLERCANFRYFGVLTSEEFFRLVDIVIVPSVSETASITTLEAMASGKAVVASNTSPMNEYIQHGVTGLLANDDDQILHHCRELIERHGFRRALGERAQLRAKDYDQALMLSRVLEMYQKVAKKGG